MPENPTTFEELNKRQDVVQLRKIYEALFIFDENWGRLPDTLVELVSSELLKANEIFIERADKGIQAPVYYPGYSIFDTPPDPRTILLAYFPEGTEWKIVVMIDGEIRALKREEILIEQDTPPVA